MDNMNMVFTLELDRLVTYEGRAVFLLLLLGPFALNKGIEETLIGILLISAISLLKFEFLKKYIGKTEKQLTKQDVIWSLIITSFTIVFLYIYLWCK